MYWGIALIFLFYYYYYHFFLGGEGILFNFCFNFISKLVRFALLYCLILFWWIKKISSWKKAQKIWSLYFYVLILIFFPVARINSSTFFLTMTASWNGRSHSPKSSSMVMFNLWQFFFCRRIFFISFSSFGCCVSYSLQFKWKYSGVSFTLQVDHSGEVSMAAFVPRKGCIHYIVAGLFFMSKRDFLWNKEECFLFCLKSSFHSWVNQILNF